jgi:TPP-dependent indolepyruvate ferredoxin oxidoreductase alpha subunit
MYCDFVQFNREPGKELDGLLYPLESAARVLLNAGVTTAVGYEGYPVKMIRELRETFKKAPGEKNPADVK